MARDHGRIRTRIWAKREFRALTSDAQRIYFVALSQSAMSHAGVVPYQPRRWASLATDSTQPKVRRSVDLLEQSGFATCDEDTEELYLRNFVKHDGVLAQPNVVTAMVRSFDTILSDRIQHSFLTDLHALYVETSHEERYEKGWARAEGLLCRTLPEGFPNPYANPSGNPSPGVSLAGAGSPSPYLSPSPNPDDSGEVA